jgi:hypothetical protein
MYSKRNPKKFEKDETPVDIRLQKLITLFLNNEPYLHKKNVSEFEVRFGGYGTRFTKIDYDNVINKLVQVGFNTTEIDGSDLLRIYTFDKTDNDYNNPIRIEINGFQAIQSYCKNDDIEKIKLEYPHSIYFSKKLPIKDEEDRPIKPIDVPDFILKYAYSNEENIHRSNDQITQLLLNYDEKKKMFRYMNRVSLIHDTLPIKCDISIVKMSSKMTNAFTIKESGVFTNPEIYEIELEIDNSKINSETTTASLIADIKKVIKYVLMGLQGTNYPVSYKEQREVLEMYQNMIQFTDAERRRNVTQQFLGPSSNTLQIENIVEPNEENINIPNIRVEFVVTEKADGERALLFISNNGKVYLINTNMNFIFTGTLVTDKELYNTLLDGEYIDKSLYAAFDAYYYRNTDYRNLPFFPKREGERCRIELLQQCVLNINISLKSIIPNSKSLTTVLPIKIIAKEFYDQNPNILDNVPDDIKIFTACDYVYNKQHSYNTDGLIFTPKYFGVGSNNELSAGPKKKITWDYSFKWKPPQFNTIDFLIKTKKNPDGSDVVFNLNETGLNTSSVVQIQQYKSIYLFVGTNEIYDNPCESLYKGEFIDKTLKHQNYKPVIFKPKFPPDPDTGVCNILLKNGQMKTDEDEVFIDNMIVEFSYDLNEKSKWNWKPLRIRYDKTSRYKQGIPEYGNSFHVANSNWSSIHNPITERMITSGRYIPNIVDNQDKYYNRVTNVTNTRSLRDFHNLYVKKILITSVSKERDRLIDYACGKAGDLSKWIEAKLGFVFGIDIFADNLNNKTDGACVRYLETRRKDRNVPDALFVEGDSSKNIKDGTSIATETGKLITQSIFGLCERKTSNKVGKYVEEQYGKGKDGFNISSCQFAVHYFFKNAETCKNFFLNVAECTKKNGYFIGTCYNGSDIFKLLNNYNIGETIRRNKNGKMIWEITKNYDKTEFKSDSSSLGYEIIVYQESINNRFSEYLVNFDFLEKIMRSCGFELLTDREARQIGLPYGCGSFKSLYTKMVDLYDKDPYINKLYEEACQMSQSEQFVSFLNMFFVFKKARDVNLSNFTINIDDEDYQMPEEIIVKPKTNIKIEESKPKTEKIKSVENKSGIVKKYDMTLVLEDVSKKTVKIRETSLSNKTKKVSPTKKEVTKSKAPIKVDLEEGSDEEITPPTKSKAPTKVELEEEKSQFVKKKEVTKSKAPIKVELEEGSDED